MSRLACLIAVPSLCAGIWIACSPSKASAPTDDMLGTTSAGGGQLLPNGSLAGTSGFGGGSSGTTGVFNVPDASSEEDASCGALTYEPEQIIVYHDATVTDTTYSYSPIALFIMMDRSGSMTSGFPPPA